GLVDLHPAPASELHGGEPLVAIGRFDGTGPRTLVITGATADGRPFRQELALALPERSDELPGLQRLWARYRIEALTAGGEVSAAAGAEVTDLALKHSLMSPFTSLVAEDTAEPARKEPAAPPETAAGGGEDGRAAMVERAAVDEVDEMEEAEE